MLAQSIDTTNPSLNNNNGLIQLGSKHDTALCTCALQPSPGPHATLTDFHVIYP